MKKIIYLIFFCFCFSSISALETKIIYKIENEIITNIDIKNEFKYLIALNNQLEELDKEQVFNIAKESIIREKIKTIEVSKNFKTLEIDKNYIAILLKNIYTRLNLKSLEEFIIYLEKYKLNLTDIEKKIAIDALWNETIIIKYSSKIEIDEQELKNKIIKNSNKEIKEYNLSEIIYEVDDTKNIEKKYKEIKKNIAAIGFENSASIYSISDTSKIGGNTGWVREESLNIKIMKNISKLKLNDISKPIIIPNGILILKVNEIRKVKNEIDYEAELQKLINYERERQLNQYSKIYFNKVKKNTGFDE
jgi:peptidyl-prolyl cis-trans isomerase SurA|tara:strand:- start:1603 stop:2520 length:918 start_codon:yes stop_codon:yes gene_type:complete